jgi:probable HAF family extracellular repeat protein
MAAAYGINDSGRIVGGYNNMWLDGWTSDHGFELKKNSFSTINYPGAVQTGVFGINKKGDIVGAFEDTAGNIHGFKFSSGTYTQLDYPGAKELTAATGINNSGDIVGTYADPTTGNAVGFLLSGSTYTSIAFPGAPWTWTNAINNAGIVVGYYFDTSNVYHGFTWDKGTITTIDYGNGYPNTILTGINDGGTMVGAFGSNQTIGSISYTCEHGFLYSSGTFTTFDAPFGDVQVTQP